MDNFGLGFGRFNGVDYGTSSLRDTQTPGSNSTIDTLDSRITGSNGSINGMGGSGDRGLDAITRLPPLKTANNNMNSKVNKLLDRIPENLSAHGTTPSGKPRLFVCAVCTRAFARHEHLKRHERSHTKEKPFSCGVCQRRFSRRDLLLRHAQKLHEGCNDAIKRLRRRSSRAKSASSPNPESFSGGSGTEDAGTKRAKYDSPTPQGESFKYFFNNDSVPDNKKSQPQFSNPNYGDYRGRRTSFSAVSGPNYASVPESLQQRPHADSVGFASPQLAPVNESATDHSHSMQNWISDINTLPGLDFLSNFSLNQPRTTQEDAHAAQVLGIGPTTTAIDTPGTLPTGDGSSTRRSSKSGVPSRKKRTLKDRSNSDIFGYSFYDDDYTLSTQNHDFHNLKLSYPKLPSTYLNETTSTSSPGGETSSNNPQNFNEYELLSDLEVPNHEEKILSVGYSFYESNDFASSADRTFGENQKIQSSGGAMDVEQPSDATLRASFNMSTSHLFTPSLTDKVASVLSRYPYSGLSAPDLPSLDYLNYFVESFKDRFLNHHPFIHENYLNEKSMFEYTMNNDSPDDFAPAVCLPLLVATIGALYSKQKKLSADLYECSRRCIHVYLDSRKKNDEAEKSTTHNSPLWLVQALILSVMYGLFAEYDLSDLSVILRQVNALCTLIKVSKFNLIRFTHENIEINEDYFRDYILYQSKVRTVFMIFNISSTLTCFYNLDPFLKYKEIKCDLPDLENYWSCRTLSEFKQNCIKSSLNYNLNLEKIMNDMLLNNQINYKISEFGSTVMMYSILQYFYLNKKSVLTNYSVGISPDHMNSSNLVKNYTWEDTLTDLNMGINMESLILRNITVIRSLMIDLSKVKEAMWSRSWDVVCSEFMSISPKNDDLIDACDYSVRTLSMMFLNDVNSSNFSKCQSLSSQALFFNFFYVTKFLHRFERKILKQVLPSGGVKPQDTKMIPKNFSIYVKIAKFLADLEQLLTKNFGFHDPESKLALREFDPSRITFGTGPRLLDIEYPREVNLENVVKIVSLRLSSNMLKIGEFVFRHIYEEEMAFNIFKSLSEGMLHMRRYLENDLAES